MDRFSTLICSRTLGHAAQGGDVLEHLREGHGGLDQLHVGGLVDELADHASPGVEVADDVTHVLLRCVHLHLETRTSWGSAGVMRVGALAWMSQPSENNSLP